MDEYVTREEFDRFRQKIDSQLASVNSLESEVRNMAIDMSNKLDTISKDIKDSQQRQGERIGQLEKHEIEHNYRFKELDKIDSKLEQLQEDVITKDNVSMILEPISVKVDTIYSNVQELRDSKKNITSAFVKNTVGIIVAIVTAYLVLKLGLK